MLNELFLKFLKVLVNLFHLSIFLNLFQMLTLSINIHIFFNVLSIDFKY